MRTMYGPLRMLYGLPTRRKKSRPPTLPLKIKRTVSSEWEYVPVLQDRYPFLITFPYFEAPGALTCVEESAAKGPTTQHLWIRGASPYYDFQALLQSLTEELGVQSLMPEAKAEVPAFCSLLAKIAFSYAVAERGAAVPRSQLSGIAVGENMQNCLHYIGSLDSAEPPSSSLHELSIEKLPESRSVLVRLRLFAKLGTPTYLVIVPNEEPLG